jgi:hypothetical protein
MMMMTMKRFVLSAGTTITMTSIATADATIITMEKVKLKNMALAHTYTTVVSPST